MLDFCPVFANDLPRILREKSRRKGHAVILGRFNFAGPFTDLTRVHDLSGVYAIVAFDNPAPCVHGVVDVGESQALRTRLATHDRAPLWKSYNRRGLGVVVLYCDARSRMAVERELRLTLRPPCGEY